MRNILFSLIITLLFSSYSSAQNPYPIISIDTLQFVNQSKLTAVPANDLPDYISPNFVNLTYRDTVRFDGIVVSNPQTYGLSTSRKAAYIQREGGGPWSGVLVLCDPITTPSAGRPTLPNFITETKFYENMIPGNKVRVTGRFANFQGETQMNVLRNNANWSNAVEQVDLNTHQPVYSVITIDSLMSGNPTAGTWSQKKVQGEKWEGVLVEIKYVRVASRLPVGGTRWNWSLQDTFGNQIDVRDFSAYYRNDDNEAIVPPIANNFTPPLVGTTLGYIRGVITEYQISGITRYGIAPITPEDVIVCDSPCSGLFINAPSCTYTDNPMVFNISQYKSFLADTGIFEFSIDSNFNNVIKFDTFSTFSSNASTYSNIQNLNIGNYFVRLRLKSQSVISNFIKFNLSISNLFVADTIIAFKKDSILLDAGPNFSRYLWNTGDTTQTIWIKHPSIYKVSVQNVFGCTVTDSTQVLFAKGIEQKDTIICQGSNINLSTPIYPQISRLSWSTNQTTNSIIVSPNISTTYYCDITFGSYTFRDSVRIYVRNLPNKNVSYTKLGLCKNDTIALSANTGYIYNWFKNGSTIGSLQILNVAEQGAYQVVLTDSFGCNNYSDPLFVFNAPLANVQFIIDDTAQCVKENMFSFKDSTLLDSGTYNRLWNFGSGNTSTQMEPTFNFAAVGTYPIKLQVNTNYGCKDSLTKTVTVLPNPTAGPMLGATTALSVATPYVYTVAQQLNHTYNWVVTNGIIAAGQGTNAATVQWLSNGKGNLKAEVTNTQGCIDTTATQVTIGNVGLHEAGNINSLMVYPNPSNGTFAVSFNALKSSTVEMSLVNLLGQQIWNTQHTIQAGEQTIQINANMSPGVYTLYINNHDEQVQHKVMIK